MILAPLTSEPPQIRPAAFATQVRYGLHFYGSTPSVWHTVLREGRGAMHSGTMTVWELTVLLWIGSAIAGLLGSLTGLGGGVVLVPLLTLFFNVDIRYAIGASLVSVIATSSGAAAAYVKEGISNIRIGMFLDIATTLGALLGAFLAAKVPTSAIAIIFGAVLLYSAYLSARVRVKLQSDEIPDPLATRLRLNGSFPTPDGIRHYFVRRVPAGFSLMFGAGALSGLLGIGSGAVKVLALDQAMRIPFKVSTTTSNFMIGVTAAASAGVYLSRGYIDPGLSMPVMLGVVAGSLAGTRILVQAETKRLRLVFSIVILLLGAQMIYNGAAGKI
ncbi:MAG TPA: sulfite exporter TauE/SafE family protein [Terriglobales bacterium]|nr:sulfite exporter TauE/SafE family protein [Terriglobales bacterium]